MPTSISWDEFRLVKAIADAKSLVGAAERLAINHSTVFRRLGALEETMGVRLFERSRNGYAPTPAGDEMIALAGKMEQEIVDFERAVAGRSAKPAGELRLTTNDAFLNWLIAPMLASFRKAYPEIRLEVIVGHEHLNLSRRDADVALRATLEPQETLVGRKIAHIGWAAYGPANWKGGEHERQWVGFGEGPGVAGPRRWFEDNVAPDAIVCRVDSVAGVARAVEAGIGSGLLPCLIGDRLAGVERLGDKLPFGDDMWLLTHPDLRHSARVRAFMEHAATELTKLRRVIEGDA
ncbi:MAG: LysR family transcriptional regulator [Beijerinckiaceae bacterium]